VTNQRDPTSYGDLIPFRAWRDDGPSVTVGEATLRASQLLEAAGAIAERVKGAPAAAVHAGPELETVVAVLGCLIAGVPAVPVPPDVGAGERQHILTDSGAAVWLGEHAVEPRLHHVRVALDARSSVSFAEPEPASTALIMYTSGTTGPPKGAMLSRRAIAACLDGLSEAWDFTPEDILVHGLPLFHVHGLVLGVLGPLRVGSSLVHTVRPTPAEYAKAVTTRRGSLLFGVPTVWSRVVSDQESARALSAARLLVSGSAPLPLPVAKDLAQLTGHVPLERYGMTETLITLSQRAGTPRRPGWVGHAIRGVEARVLDDAGDAVPLDGQTPGNLQVRGETLFDGYRSQPAGIDADGWFGTGDIAAVDETGEYRIVGRKATDLIKSGGYRIGAGEIEAALLGHPGVSEVSVVGLPDADLGERIVAFVVPVPGQHTDPQALIQFVADTLSVHKRPREVRFIDTLPRNALGKVQKHRLKA
jgi:fatty acid CoA ligase FadD36